MKTFLPVLLFVIFSSLSYAQQDEQEVSMVPNSLSKGKTYALIIGISEYAHDSIRDLRFAHRDAEAFYNFLTSQEGGMVPTENIRMLINKQATVSNIYIAKRWLETEAKKDDVVFFYFAGHGDVEQASVFELGFLLAHDTPYQNYFNNAVRIEDINIMASILSISKEANVYLITDACHSGKLAGSDFRGRLLAGEQLMKAENHELRIASCKASQEAEEDEFWGQGRGAFSFFLINGLRGMADRDSNNVVTFDEIKLYIDTNVPQSVLKVKNKQQNPVSLGERPEARLSIVNKESLTMALLDTLQTFTLPADTSAAAQSTSRSVRSKKSLLELSTEKFFAGLSARFTSTAPESNSIYKDLRLEGDNAIIRFFLDSFLATRDTLIRKAVDADLRFRTTFKQQLAAVMHDRVQQVINKYLDGDDEEIEKRMYYSHLQSGYTAFPAFIEVAMKLLEEDHPLFKILEVKLHYFQGLIHSLKLPPKGGAGTGTIVQAILEQQKAFELDKNAAYVMNELGMLFSQNKETDNADKFLRLAVRSAPKWPVALANLSEHFAKSKDFNKGIENALKSLEYKKDYQFGHLNLARNYEGKGNIFAARKHYFKTLLINPRPFFAYERLALIALATQEYQLAEKLLNESEKRKSQMPRESLKEVNARSEELFKMMQTAFSGSDPAVMLADSLILSGDSIKADSFVAVLQKPGQTTVKDLNRHLVKYFILKNQPEKALDILNKELALKPRNPEIEYSMARCFAMSDKKKEARDALLDAVQHGFKNKRAYQADRVFNKFRIEFQPIQLMMR